MTNLFNNGFESGDLTGWEFSDATGAGTVAASTSAVKNGTYGVRSAVNNNTSDTSDRGLVAERFTTPANGKLYLEGWFRLTSFTSAGYGTSTSKSLAVIMTDANNQANAGNGRKAFYLTIQAGPQIQAYYSNRQDDTKVAVGTAFSVTANTWYRVRMMADKSGANPILQWWTSTDGTTFTDRGSATDTSTDGSGALHYDLDAVGVGIVHVGQFEKGIYTVDWDDVTADDAPFSAGQAAAPNADVSDGAWTNQSGSQIDLYASIDEASASDSDYIQSSLSPSVADVCEVGLVSLTDPAVSTGHIVRYRYGKSASGGDRIDLTVSLRQGASTEIAAWSHTDLSSTLADAAQTLTSGQADAITNYADLRLRFSAVKV